jgi:hyperosmotically inducible periplasmic protein
LQRPSSFVFTLLDLNTFGFATKNIFYNSKKKGTKRAGSRVSNSAAGFGDTYKNYMNRTILSLLCISTLALSAVVAQEVKPDNSGKNERDRSGETKTSGDQSNSSADIKIAADVRNAIVKDSSLTMAAKNVKVITAGGIVTLRGPVNSAEEKTKIEQLAATAANGARIDNQLEIKESH